MLKNITRKLTSNPSYLKKGDEWLADYFGCSPRTINKIKAQLRTVKADYLRSLA